MSPVETVRGTDDSFEPASLVYDAVLIPRTDRFTLDELATNAGVDRESTQLLWRALGFPDPPEDARIAGEIDDEALQQVTLLLEGRDAPDNSIRRTRIYSAAIADVMLAASATLEPSRTDRRGSSTWIGHCADGLLRCGASTILAARGTFDLKGIGQFDLVPCVGAG